jgi:ribosomal protein S4E
MFTEINQLSVFLSRFSIQQQTGNMKKKKQNNKSILKSAINFLSKKKTKQNRKKSKSLKYNNERYLYCHTPEIGSQINFKNGNYQTIVLGFNFQS